MSKFSGFNRININIINPVNTQQIVRTNGIAYSSITSVFATNAGSNIRGASAPLLTTIDDPRGRPQPIPVQSIMTLDDSTVIEQEGSIRLPQQSNVARITNQADTIQPNKVFNNLRTQSTNRFSQTSNTSRILPQPTTDDVNINLYNSRGSRVLQNQTPRSNPNFQNIRNSFIVATSNTAFSSRSSDYQKTNYSKASNRVGPR